MFSTGGFGQKSGFNGNANVIGGTGGFGQPSGLGTGFGQQNQAGNTMAGGFGSAMGGQGAQTSSFGGASNFGASTTSFTGAGAAGGFGGQTTANSGFGTNAATGFGQGAGNTGFGGMGGTNNGGLAGGAPGAFGQGFGAGNTASSFGAGNNTGGFGTSFGQPANNTGFGGNTGAGFGQTNNFNNTGFGQTNAASGFGQSTTGIGFGTTNNFGQTGQVTGFGQATGTGFGQTTGTSFGQGPSSIGVSNIGAQNNTLGQGFNQTNAGPFSPVTPQKSTAQGSGTRSTNFKSQTVTGVGNKTERIHSISADPNFKDKSVEELHWLDRQLESSGGGFGGAMSSSSNQFGKSNSLGFGGSTSFQTPAPAGSFGASNGNSFGNITTSTSFSANKASTTGFGGTSFGGNTSTGFGSVSTAATNTFGATNTGGFGNTSFGNTGGFGNPGAGSSFGGTGGFGTPAATGGFGASATTGGFGAPASTGGFGGSTFGTPATTGGFGASATTGGFGTPATGGFGAPASTGGFGAPASTGGFGASATTGGFGAPASTGGFGASASTGGFGAPASTGGFGTSTSTGGFGASTSTGGFGASTSTGGFGAPASTGGFGAGFGSSSTLSSTGGFGAPSASGFGSTAPSSGGFGSTTTSGGFGSTPASSSFSLSGTSSFGSSSTPSLGGFGATSTGGFGSSSAPGSTVFGASSFGNTTSSAGGFGSTPASGTFSLSGTSSFGSSSTPSLGGFGATGTGGFGSSSLGGFGANLGMSTLSNPAGAAIPSGQNATESRSACQLAEKSSKDAFELLQNKLELAGNKLKKLSKLDTTEGSNNSNDKISDEEKKAVSDDTLTEPISIFIAKSKPAAKPKPVVSKRESSPRASQSTLFSLDESPYDFGSVTNKPVAVVSDDENDFENLLPVKPKDGYSMKPSMDELKKMKEIELKSIKNFSVSNAHGSIVWDTVIDVTKLDLHSMITIEPKRVEVDHKKDPVHGKKLNKPATITLYSYTAKPGKEDVYERALQEQCKINGSHFVSWDPSGKFTFRVDHFSSYEFMDDDLNTTMNIIDDSVCSSGCENSVEFAVFLDNMKPIRSSSEVSASKPKGNNKNDFRELVKTMSSTIESDMLALRAPNRQMANNHIKLVQRVPYVGWALNSKFASMSNTSSFNPCLNVTSNPMTGTGECKVTDINPILSEYVQKAVSPSLRGPDVSCPLYRSPSATSQALGDYDIFLRFLEFVSKRISDSNSSPLLQQAIDLIDALVGQEPGDCKPLYNETAANNFSGVQRRRMMFESWLRKYSPPTSSPGCFDHLISLEVNKAADKAESSGMFRLALLLIQANGDLVINKFAAQQVQHWQNANESRNVDADVLRSYRLLAGNFESNSNTMDSKSENILIGQGWFKALIAYYAYYFSEDDVARKQSVLERMQKALMDYETAVDKATADAPESVFNAESNDPIFALLRLVFLDTASVENKDVVATLLPKSLTDNPLDYSVSYLILVFLESLGKVHDSYSTSLVRQHFISQLLSQEKYREALIVAMQIRDDTNRENSVRHILQRYCKVDQDIVAFARDVLRVPNDSFESMTE